MSVINQMLKELEERNDPAVSTSSNRTVEKHTERTPRLILIILLIVVINICGIYAWGLYSENKALKSAAHTSLQTLPNEKPEEITPIILAKEPTDEVIIQSLNKGEKELTQQETNQSSVKQVVQQKTNEPEPLIKREVQETFKEDNVVITPLHDKINNKDVKESSDVGLPVEPEKQSSLSISRSKLSPERVVQNKLQKAEQAIIDNDIPKAEKLFEDILLIQPSHKGARKQLSALWFGRKLFRPALNLLSQGIAIYSDDIDFRLMKARILINQNNSKEALDVLQGLAKAQNVEYQVLLANTAQTVGNSESAILAYRQLVKLEPHKSNWWMGLAVALDRSSQFKKAYTAYDMALSTGNLSSNSAQFTRQRMSELGEY